MSSRPQYTDLTIVGGTGPCGPMRIIFGGVIYIPVWFIWKVPDPIFNTDRPMANISLFTKIKLHSSLRSDAIVITTDGQTDIAQMSWNFALIKCLQGT